MATKFRRTLSVVCFAGLTLRVLAISRETGFKGKAVRDLHTSSQSVDYGGYMSKNNNMPHYSTAPVPPDELLPMESFEGELLADIEAQHGKNALPTRNMTSDTYDYGEMYEQYHNSSYNYNSAPADTSDYHDYNHHDYDYHNYNYHDYDHQDYDHHNYDYNFDNMLNRMLVENREENFLSGANKLVSTKTPNISPNVGGGSRMQTSRQACHPHCTKPSNSDLSRLQAFLSDILTGKYNDLAYTPKTERQKNTLSKNCSQTTRRVECGPSVVKVAATVTPSVKWLHSQEVRPETLDGTKKQTVRSKAVGPQPLRRWLDSGAQEAKRIVWAVGPAFGPRMQQL